MPIQPDGPLIRWLQRFDQAPEPQDEVANMDSYDYMTIVMLETRIMVSP